MKRCLIKRQRFILVGNAREKLLAYCSFSNK